MSYRTLQRILFDSLWPCVVLVLAFCFLKPYGMSRVPDVIKFIQISTCETSACFLGRCFALLIGYYCLKFRYDPCIPFRRVLINFIFLYLLYIPLTGFLLCVIHYFYLPENPHWDNPFTPGFWLSFRNNCSVVTMYSVFFYLIDVFLSRFRQTRMLLEDVRQGDVSHINEMLRQQQTRHEAPQPEEESDSFNPEQCTLHSDYGDKDLELHPRDFIYAESISNYVSVSYLDENDNVCSATLRTTLKQIKEDLAGHDSIVQCHRGFLVNLRCAKSLEGSNNCFFLHLVNMDKKIPVSRAYKTDIKEALLGFQS